MNNLSGQQAGAPDSVSAGTASTPEQPTQETIKPMTLEQYREIAREEATRAAQSLVDKAEHRISRRAQEQINALELTKGTLGLSDEDVTKARQQIVLNDLSTKPAEPSSPATQTQTSAQTETDPVIAETLEVFKQEGITIETSDPEYKPLDAILRDPNGNIHKYRRELFRQIEAKRVRVATNAQQAAARVISGGQNQTGEAKPNASAHEMWEGAYKKA